MLRPATDVIHIPAGEISMTPDIELLAILGVALTCGGVFYAVVARCLLLR